MRRALVLLCGLAACDEKIASRTANLVSSIKRSPLYALARNLGRVSGCDMVKRADLAVIADSSEVLAALVELVEGVKKEQRNAA